MSANYQLMSVHMETSQPDSGCRMLYPDVGDPFAAFMEIVLINLR